MEDSDEICLFQPPRYFFSQESGFIVEIAQKEQNNNNDDSKSHYGIVSVETKKSKC